MTLQKGHNNYNGSSFIAHIQCSARFTDNTPGHWTCSFMYHGNSLLEHTALQPFRRYELLVHIVIYVLPNN